MLLRKIKFVEEFRCYKQDEEIEFKKGLNIISGDNGSGKSSLLSCIRNMYNVKWSMSDDSSSENKIEINDNAEKNTSDKVVYLDLCSDLYKNSVEFDYDNMNTYMQCLNSSSGEGVIFQLVDFLKKSIEDSRLIIIDEPERGLSIKNQILISQIINKFVEDNPEIQFLVTTHSQYIFSLDKELWSTSHKSFISIEDYIKWMYTQSIIN